MSIIFFFNDTATTEIYTLSLHDALPISCLDRDVDPGADREPEVCLRECGRVVDAVADHRHHRAGLLQPAHLRDLLDRKSTRLNSSHANISYAVFCLKKKNTLHRQSLRPN